MKWKTTIGLIIILIFYLVYHPKSFSMDSQLAKAASKSLATLENVNGEIFIKRGGGLTEFRGINGTIISQGDSVRTDKMGSAKLVFSTGSKMTAGPNTSFTIDKLIETRASGLKVVIKLNTGTLWNSVVSFTNAEDEYEIITASSIAEVRGTLFLVIVDPGIGQTSFSVCEGSVLASPPGSINNPGSLNQAQLLQMGQSGTVLPPQRTPGSSIYNPQFPAAPPPPPPPQPIDTQSLVQNQSPSILANMAMDMVDRMQEMQRQNEALMASYQNTNNPAYLQSALQQSQVNSLLGSLNQQYMSDVQGSPQEQQMNQFLQQQNRNMDALQQQAQQLQDQAMLMRNNTEEAAQQAGLSPDQIQRLLQNAVTASAAAGARQIAPPSNIPNQQPSTITPSIPPISGPGSYSGNIPHPGQDGDDYELHKPISDLRSSSVSGTSITLEWSKAQNPSYVTLQTAYDGLNWTNYVGNHSIGDTAITVYDLNPNSRYYFRLVIASGSNRGDSNMISITTDKLPLIEMSDITGMVRIGETLTAGAVAPELATVKYQWQIADSLDGIFENIAGENDHQYIITADNVNKYIRLVADGTGDYTGTVISMPTEAVGEPIPISWLLPMPTVRFNTDGDTPQIIVDYIANQRGAINYIVTDAQFVLEDDQELIDLLTFGWEGNDHILLKGSEAFSLEESESLVIPYSEKIHANKAYNLYLVLKGVNNTYSEVERISFTTPRDENPPALSASVVYNEATGDLNINHLVKDYDELYDLYVWVIPKDYSPNGEPTAQEVKELGLAAQNVFSCQSARVDNVATVTIPNYQPATEYIIYLVAQDQSHIGENEEGLYSEVIEASVTTPIPSTA